MKNVVLACVVALAISTTAIAGDIAISTQGGWMSQGHADNETQEIVNNVTGASVELFASGQQDALADWVVAHTGNGQSDLLVLFGVLPDSIYPAGNAQPDGSLAELFLDDGNIIVNTGDYIFYVGSAGLNNQEGLMNMSDTSASMWGDDVTTFAPTAEGHAVAPSLTTWPSNRPLFPAHFEGTDWEVELILAQNSDGSQVHPAILHNTVTDGRLGVFFQRSDDSQPRGEVISEWINNWYLTGGVIPNSPAEKPDPADGKMGVTMPLLQWTPGYGAVVHNVYFGETPETLAMMTATSDPMYFHPMPLTPGATYYWRVDEVAADGSVTEGDVWSFTTMPLEAHLPSPYDGALWRKTDITFSWAAGQGALSHRLYGGTDEAAVAAGDESVFLGEQADTSVTIGELAPDTRYYWRIDEVGPSGVVPGPVWTFTTIDPDGGAIAEYWANMNLAGDPDVVTTVPEINFDWGGGAEPGINSPDPAIPVDRFSCRWTAQLNVPVSGTYRFFEASDDGARLFLNGDQIAWGWWDRGTTEDASGEIELEASGLYLLQMEMYENGGGATAFLRWEGPGIPKEIIPQGALQIPEFATCPLPADGATEISDSPVLSWTPGATAVEHSVYLGTDEALVAAGDPSVLVGTTTEPSIAPAGPLDWNTTYYWKVDEVMADGGTMPGFVWSFTVADFIVIYPGQVTLNYDNSAEPFVSELALDVPADLTAGGATDLAMRLQGRPGPQGDVVLDEATETYTVTGNGNDIWGNSDQFTYAYKTLNGDASIVARVVSIGPGSNTWAKGGVMIRQSVDGGSNHAMTVMTANSDGTAGNGASFQRRVDVNGSSANSDSGEVVAPPYYVKLDRVGNTFTGSISADGETWTQLGDPVDVVMTDPVLIGLGVTSHQSGELRTVTFDSVSTTGDVSEGPFTTWTVVGIPYNAPEPLYVAIEDATGAVAAVPHPDNPMAVNMTSMGLWRIPLSEFGGVDLTNVAKMYIGVGDGQPGGSGTMDFADIRGLTPVTAPDPDATDVTAPGDPVIGQPDDGNWPGGESPDLAIDDNAGTKFLHFGGATGPSGIIVTPMGYTVVTGLTFTTANDAPERDPVAFELYGSNMGTEGPWNLIAQGTIDDFARPIEWPRYTKNVTPIGFANTAAYGHYKVMVTAVRAPASANSMQVAEIELLGVAATEPIPVPVENASFEQPGDPDKNFIGPPMIRGFDRVPGWSTDGPVAHSGLIKGARPTDGAWSAHLTAGDASVWQLTDHTIKAGEVLELDINAWVILGAIRDARNNLKMSLYYDDGGKRVTVSSYARPLPYDPWTYKVSFDAANAPEAVGHKIGIEFSNVSDNVLSLDDVHLRVR